MSSSDSQSSSSKPEIKKTKKDSINTSATTRSDKTPPPAPSLLWSFVDQNGSGDSSTVAPGRTTSVGMSSTIRTANIVTASTPASTKSPTVPSTDKTSPEEDLEAVGRFLRRGTVAGWSMYAVLLFVTFRFAPIDSYARLEGNELRACWTMTILLFVTNGSRILPLAFQNNGLHFMKSGILMGSFSVQCMALLNAYIMAVAPTPIMTDRISGTRIHLVRFAAWTPLCFMMTFLTEAIDIPLQKDKNWVPWWHASALALSTVCGGILPFCHTLTAWWTVMVVSWVLFCTIYVRLYKHYARYQKLLRRQQIALLQAKQRRRNQSHRSLNAIKETVDRTRFSFHLILLCTIAWTGIAVSFTACCAIPKYLPSDSFWANPEIPLLSGYVLESFSKIWYLSLQLQVYDRIFDEANRSVRKLEVLRTLMSALWEASSDILVICDKSEQTIHAVLSPNALLQPQQQQQNSLLSFQSPFDERLTPGTACMSIMLEITPHLGTFCSFPVDLSKPLTRVDAGSIQQARASSRKQFGNLEDFQHLKGSTAEKNLTTIAHLALQVCENHLANESDTSDSDDHSQSDDQPVTAGNDSWMLQELFAPPKEGNTKESRVKCEAKVTPIDAGALLLVLRDVSERYQRFEVEKQLLEEVIVRKKDAEAIRFTRHEVKNGLLAAIGLVDSFREVYEKQKSALVRAQAAQTVDRPDDAQVNPTENPQNSKDDSQQDLDNYINELDSTLKDVLEVILDNAMTREVIFEGYVPRRESVDLPVLIQTARKTRNSKSSDAGHSPRQFPVEFRPELFPDLVLDPQLIRSIYQSAISNACKYGQKDGEVKTILHYDRDRQMFKLEVKNLPGYAHDELLKLPQDEIECVFLEGTQLRANQCLGTEEGKLASARSSGDGAWIMQKGAQCLGGKCGIHFETHGTTFTLECPAVICEEWQGRRDADPATSAAKKDAFSLPDNVWAIAVEDSAMQRKLLERFLKKAGISDDHFISLGKSPDEIHNFTETIREKMEEHPNNKFLLIIDENLDILEGGVVTKTVSGSFSIQKLRESLDPSTEARMLALIRSANDSVKEVELYQTRGHGFLLKGPMKKGGLLEEIKPWWIRRFVVPAEKDHKEEKRIGLHKESSSFSESVTALDELGPARERIVDLVKEVNAMTSFPSGEYESNEEDSFESDQAQSLLKKRSTLLMDWQSIRYKLMLLNVDLKNYSSVDSFALAAKSIDEITNTQAGAFLPQDLQNRWKEIRGRIFKEL